MSPRPPLRRAVLKTAAALWLAPALWVGGARAHDPRQARDSALKAEFLFKFAGFVEWPPDAFRSPGAPLVIGVYGDEAVAKELELITKDRKIAGRPVKVRRVASGSSIGRVHILYAGGDRRARARAVIAAARGSVLTVTDGDVGGSPGPVLFFTPDEERVRFGASLPAANARGLKLSSRLLAIAQQVER